MLVPLGFSLVIGCLAPSAIGVAPADLQAPSPDGVAPADLQDPSTDGISPADMQGVDAAAPSQDAGSAASQGGVVGAVYVAATAYNADQMWMEYDSQITKRDLGYAKQINLNALRVFGSYYAYAQDAARYESNIRDLLATAQADGMKVLFVIYENCGWVFDDQILRTLKDPLRAIDIQSPAQAVTSDATKWDPYRAHVKWFMDRFKDDSRFGGIEVINEPADSVKPFAHAMVQVAVANKGSIPITVGTLPDQILEYVHDGVSLLQFHNNFPGTLAESEQIIQQRLAQAGSVGLPIWMTEWQRLRPSGPGWSGTGAVPAAERYTDLGSMASQVVSHESEMGSFFWSLMVKPAYLEGQRNAGTINGLFWEDGAVWDLAGARILANNPSLSLPERQRIPFEILNFVNRGTQYQLQGTNRADGSGMGKDVQAVPTSVATGTKWQLIRIDGSQYFRIQNMDSSLWLQCSSVTDATNGKPSANDNKTLAVRAVDQSVSDDSTLWYWTRSGAGDWSFHLQNKATGYYLQGTSLADTDGGGGYQVRAVPSTYNDSSVHFSSVDASH